MIDQLPKVHNSEDIEPDNQHERSGMSTMCRPIEFESQFLLLNCPMISDSPEAMLEFLAICSSSLTVRKNTTSRSLV